ncbi:MAG: hypothetical protein GKC05_07120 [Methanomicrobiales archaeon]|nr:hypothetical protein [Methanomicrobiales archaeon]
MITRLFPVLFALLLTAPAVFLPVSAAADAGTTGAQIAITDIRLDPEISMQDDTGTLKVRISNNGADPVSINRVELLSDEITVINYQTYDKVGTLGAGNSLEFTFLLKADVQDGTYFPIFYIDFTSAGSMRYPIPVRVDDTGIVSSVVDAPSTFSPGTKDTVTLSVGNARDNAISSVTIIPHGEGIVTTQSALFVGTLLPDEEKQVTFDITVTKSTEILFDITYRNGPNEHRSTLTLPAPTGDRKVAAELVVNSIEVTQAGTTVTISGDVTNAGLQDAKSVMVTVGSPAQPVDPNPVYVIGALEPDDFSSFEVTCNAAGATSVPLLIEYRDQDGMVSKETIQISLRNQIQSSSSEIPQNSGMPSALNRRPGGIGMFGSGVSKVPVVPIIAVIGICIAGIVIWRKGYINRIRDRFRK